MNRPDADSPEAPLRILFVCSGNTCRSPLAEVLSKREAGKGKLPSMEIRSAGTHTRSGMGASSGALRAASRHGLSLEGHASTALSRELVEWADWIFAMGPGHLYRLRELGGADKSLLLGVFGSSESLEGPKEGRVGVGVLGDSAEHLAVPDPFGGDDEVYEETFSTLEKYVESAMAWLSEEVAP